MQLTITCWLYRDTMCSMQFAEGKASTREVKNRQCGSFQDPEMVSTQVLEEKEQENPAWVPETKGGDSRVSCKLEGQAAV